MKIQVHVRQSGDCLLTPLLAQCVMCWFGLVSPLSLLVVADLDTSALAQIAVLTQSSVPHRCVGYSASQREDKLVHRQFGMPP